MQMSEDPATQLTNLAQSLGSYFHAARFEELSRPVVDKAIEHISYHFIRGLQGSGHVLSTQARQLALSLSDRGGDSSILCARERVQPIDAAFANCSMMRAIECDDNLFPVGVHAGIVTIPAALALAERHRRSGRELIAAVVSGYEAIGKLGNFATAAWSAPAPRRETILYGPFGGAVAAGVLLRLDADRMAEAIRYAAQSAMGVAEGSRWDHYYSMVARNGMLCAMLAQAGGRVSATVLEGRYGFFETFLGAVPRNIAAWNLTAERGAEMLGARVKRLPGTAWNVVPIEMMRELVRNERLQPEQVARVDIALADARRNFTLGHSLGPFEPWRACSSAPFQMAMVLLDGGESRLERYSQPQLPELLAIVGRMHVTLEPGHASDDYARIEVTTTDGRHLRREGHQFVYARWDDREELIAAGREKLPHDQLARAADMLANLSEVDDVAGLMACFIP
jgi:2-methylcitrate dehydratase PrpD